MRLNHFQLNLWAFSILGLSCLEAKSPAFAHQPSAAYSTNSELTESPAVPVRNNHTCIDLSVEQPEPLGDFREAVLKTATVAARQPDFLSESGRGLMRLSQTYACLGQTDTYKSLVTESLTTVDKIEDVDDQFYLIMDILAIYSGMLSEEQRHELSEKAIALTVMSPTYPQSQFDRFTQIAEYHLRDEEYEKALNVVDLVENTENRANIIRSIFTLYQPDSPEEQAIIEQFFPEVEFTAPNQEYVKAFHQIPLVKWINQFNHTAAVQFDQQPEDINEFIADQVSAIEQLPDTFSQTYSYVVLGQFLARAGSAERALPLLEIANEKDKSLKDTAVSADVKDYFGGLNLNSTIGTAFALAGSAERGLAIILDAYHLSESREQISTLLITAQHLIYQEQRASIPMFLEAAEQVARSLEEPEDYFISIAITYSEMDDLENTRRLAQKVLTTVESKASFGYIPGALAYLLVTVDRPEAILEIAPLVEDQGVLSEVVVQLVRENKENVAWEIFELITSPMEKISALVSISKEHQEADNLDTAFDLAVRAMTIAQSDKLAEDKSFQELSEITTRAYRLEANSNELMTVMYENLFTEIVYLAQDLEQTQQLVQLIQDDSIRLSLSDRFLRLDSETGDDALSTAARRAAREGQFQEAIAAIARMESPYEQSQTLLNIGTYHVDSTTILDVGTRQLLEKIQQQYR